MPIIGPKNNNQTIKIIGVSVIHMFTFIININFRVVLNWFSN